MKTRKMLIAVFAVLALAVGAAQAADAVVLYSEDFEGSGDLDLLSDSPHSWVKYGTSTIRISDDTSLDGLAIDGSTLSSASIALYNHTFDGGATFEQGKLYTLSFDAYATADDVGCDLGLADGPAGFYGAIGPTATGWECHWNSVTPETVPVTIVSGDGLNEVVHVVWYLDLGDTDQMWASVSDGTKTWTTAKYAFDDHKLMQSVGYWENQLAGGFDVDNIVVAEVPEETWETVLDENFNAYPDGTLLSTATGWTSIHGDVEIWNHWMTGSQIILGATINSGLPENLEQRPLGSAPTRFTRALSRSVRKGEHIRATAKIHNRYAVPGSYFGFTSTALTQPKGAIWQCNGTQWSFLVLPPFVNEGEEVVLGPYWHFSESPTWEHKVIVAEVHLDAEANTIWGVLRTSDGSFSYTPSAVPFIDGTESQVDAAYLWWTGVGPGVDSMDVDDILVEVVAVPPTGTLVVVR